MEATCNWGSKTVEQIDTLDGSYKWLHRGAGKWCDPQTQDHTAEAAPGSIRLPRADQPAPAHPDCNHRQIDNDTWKCVARGKKMSLNHWTQRDIAPRPGLTAVVDVTYDCSRCDSGECGCVHQGDPIRFVGMHTN